MQGAFYRGSKTVAISESPPHAPGPGEVRLRVAYSGICGTDYHVYLGHMDHRAVPPLVLGHEMSGVVAETGEKVTGFKAGDKVVVRPLVPCRECPACRAGFSHICEKINVLGVDTPGAFQESWTVPAEILHRLPDDIDMKQAAVIEPVAVAAHDVRLGGVSEDDYVVVLGVGPIGMMVALLAKAKGARVLISEVNGFRLNLADRMGMKAVNPEEIDLPAYVMAETGGAGADAVFEVTGSAAGAEMMTRLARTRGRIIIVGIFAGPEKVDLRQILWRELRIMGTRLYEPEDFETAIRLVAAGELPLDRYITDVRPLEQLPETFAQIERGAGFMKVLFRAGNGD